jgi:hypothetical protein
VEFFNICVTNLINKKKLKFKYIAQPKIVGIKTYRITENCRKMELENLNKLLVSSKESNPSQHDQFSIVHKKRDGVTKIEFLSISARVYTMKGIEKMISRQ